MKNCTKPCDNPKSQLDNAWCVRYFHAPFKVGQLHLRNVAEESETAMAKVKVKKKAAVKPAKSKPVAKSAKPVVKAKAKERPSSKVVATKAPAPKIEAKPIKKKIEVPAGKAVKGVPGLVQKAPIKFETPKPPKKPTAEMQQIRDKLIVMLADFRKEIDHEVRGASERDLAHINDTSDMATDAAQGDLALRIAESETVEAAEVERAIEKIDNGTYGLCEICNTRIPTERLQVLPFATQCVKCQELADIRKRSRSGDELDDLNTDGGDMEE